MIDLDDAIAITKKRALEQSYRAVPKEVIARLSLPTYVKEMLWAAYAPMP